MLEAALQRLWYERSLPATLCAVILLPMSWIFVFISAARRGLFRVGVFNSERVSKPVIVVGNISVGGTGKTPLVIWLTQALRERGFVPGVITRGYGGSSKSWPCDVAPDSDAVIVGDEAVLLSERTGAIVVAGPNRVRAAQRAIERGATVIISDDGLQHYRLARDFEIVVVDAARRFGNGFRLPAGPLRESPRRLATVDAVVSNLRDEQSYAAGDFGHRLEIFMHTRLSDARALVSDEHRSLQAFASQRVHAIAGIGNPQAFFQALRAQGLQLDARALNDHASLSAADLSFQDDAPIVMTEKDAVKCHAFADARCWAVALEVELNDGAALLNAFCRKLDRAD